MSFRKEVRKALIDAEMNQSHLAEKLGVSPSYVSVMLNGDKTVTPAFLIAITELGLLTPAIRVEYVRARGALDVSGLTSEEVAELVRRVDAMRGICS